MTKSEHGVSIRKTKTTSRIVRGQQIKSETKISIKFLTFA